MRPIKVIDTLAGTTIRTTWCSSGSAPTSIVSVLKTTSDTLVNSFAGVSSGNGFYYGTHTVPNSDHWLVNEWQAVIDGYPYTSRQLIHVRKIEVSNG